MCENKGLLSFGIISGISVVIISIVLIAVSFSSLEPTEVGLAYNGNNQQINPVPYKPGRYGLGLGSTFIKYPSTVLSIRFTAEDGKAIDARSSDGLPITIDSAVDYRLTPEELLNLYLKFPKDYDIAISKKSRDVIRSACSRFPAFSFFGARNNVSATISNDLAAALPEFHVTLTNFQLLDIKLPAAFANAIQNTQIVSQSIATAQFAQQQAAITSQTQIEAASRQASVINAKAAADAQNALTIANAQAATVTARVSNLATAYADIKTTYGMTEEDLLTWIYIQSLADTAATVVYSTNKPTDITF